MKPETTYKSSNLKDSAQDDKSIGISPEQSIAMSMPKLGQETSVAVPLGLDKNVKKNLASGAKIPSMAFEDSDPHSHS